MRRRILVLSYLFPNRAQPGYGIFVLNRLRAVGRYCDLRVVAPVQWYPFMRGLRPDLYEGEVPESEEIHGVRVWHPRFFTIPRYLKWVEVFSYFSVVAAVVRRLQSADRFDFDLIDVHWTYPDAPSAALLARLFRKPFAVTVRGHEAFYNTEKSLRRWLVSWVLRRANGVVVLSEELREEVVRLGVAREKTHVVLNGVDRTVFRRTGKAESRERLELPEERKIILSVGRLTEGKGHQHIIRALAQLAGADGTELYIVGGINPEADYSAELRKLIATHGLQNVHLVDKATHDSLPYWYSAADVFCLASESEGCPNVVLEALACGTPVVVTAVGAAPALISSGKNGFLAEDDTPASLARVLEKALAVDWENDSIAAGMESWGWDQCARTLLEFYASLSDRKTTVSGRK